MKKGDCCSGSARQGRIKPGFNWLPFDPQKDRPPSPRWTDAGGEGLAQRSPGPLRFLSLGCPTLMQSVRCWIETVCTRPDGNVEVAPGLLYRCFVFFAFHQFPKKCIYCISFKGIMDYISHTDIQPPRHLSVS